MRVFSLWLVVPALVLVAACSAPMDGDLPTARERLAAQLDAHPSTPIAVPRRLPAGYEFSGGPTYQTGQDGRILVAAWRYAPSAGPGNGPGPVVEVCVAGQQSDADQLCAPDNHGPVVIRKVNGLIVTVVPMGPEPDAAAEPLWRDVEFTTNWRGVGWIDG